MLERHFHAVPVGDGLREAAGSEPLQEVAFEDRVDLAPLVEHGRVAEQDAGSAASHAIGRLGIAYLRGGEPVGCLPKRTRPEATPTSQRLELHRGDAAAIATQLPHRVDAALL
ncbi:MAG TPA: hypothetical protein VIM76_08980 [Candidatus Dormibacteraeota bacterium]|jgi:hypothetical protein